MKLNYPLKTKLPTITVFKDVGFGKYIEKVMQEALIDEKKCCLIEMNGL